MPVCPVSAMSFFVLMHLSYMQHGVSSVWPLEQWNPWIASLCFWQHANTFIAGHSLPPKAHIKWFDRSAFALLYHGENQMDWMCCYVLKQNLLFVFGFNAKLKPTDPIGYEGEVVVKAASHSLFQYAPGQTLAFSHDRKHLHWSLSLSKTSTL